VPDTLTLERALLLAERTRGQVVVAGAGVDRARATARLGTAIPNPQVKYEHADLALTNTVEIIQPLWWLGGSGDTRSAGNASIRRARADSLRTRYTVAGEVMHAFYQVLAADQKLLLVRQQAQAADTLLRLTTRRVELGDLSELERDQASQEVATVRLLERRSFEDARVSRLALARAMGVHLQPDAIITGRLASFEPATSPSTTLIPAVVAAIEDSAAAASRLSAARWRQLPIPGLLLKWEWGGPPNVPTNTIIGFSMPFPLWQFGQHEVALANADAMERGALATEARAEATRQVAEAHERMNAARERAREATEVLYPTAQRLRVGAVRLFDSGRTGIFPVFDAFRREREAAIIMIEELLAMHSAAATLVALTGPSR